MAKILLINVDSKKPNLALHKLAKYHADRGAEVVWDAPLFAQRADEVYVSCIYSWNKHKCQEWGNGTAIGGSGYDPLVRLPAEVEQVKPRINWGFTTRGCIRKCQFCIVPHKEGKIHIVGDLLDLWDGKSKQAVLLDNNILALPQHFRLICKQARENNIKLDFNQGLDCRLLNKDILKELKSIRHEEYRFAFDSPKDEKAVEKAIRLLQGGGINRCTWYVLVGFDTSLDEDLWRLTFLRNRNQNAYVQRYNGTKAKEYIPMARWANQRHIFHGMTWQQFMARPENRKYRALFEGAKKWPKEECSKGK